MLASAPLIQAAFQWFKLGQSKVFLYLKIPSDTGATTGLRKHRGLPTIATRLRGLVNASGRGEIFRKLTSPKHQHDQMHCLWLGPGQWVDGRGKSQIPET